MIPVSRRVAPNPNVAVTIEERIAATTEVENPDRVAVPLAFV